VSVPPGAAEGPRAGRRRRGRDSIVAIALLAPSMLVFASFFFWPLYRLVHLSLHQQNRFGTAERWVGTDLYTSDRVQAEFFEGLRISGTFVLFTVPAGLLLGVLLAVAAHRRLRAIKVFQGIFSSTVASSVAVTSVVFFNLINPQVGYFGDVGFMSLSDPDTALRGVALSSIWQNLGLTFIIVLAGLQSLPEEVMEAATLDGFGPIRRFTRVTLPLLSPTLLFLAVVLVIFGMQAYAQVDILTGGGPAGATETLVYKIFNSQQPLAQGRGAVLSIGLFVITLVVSLTQFVLLERRVYYEGSRAGGAT
jgi:sn-glycerol 3-phosphate transport system permease protein